MDIATQAIYKERKDRLDKAMRLEKPLDRLPVLLMGPISLAKFADSSIVCASATRDPEYFTDKAFEAVNQLKDVDALNNFRGGFSRTMEYVFMCPVCLPGIDIGEDDNLQILEKSFMQYEDYKKIVNEGWNAYSEQYIKEHLSAGPDDFSFDEKFAAYVDKKFDETGYVSWGGGVSPMPWDLLSSMRGMTRFFRDLRKDKQLIHEVIDAIDRDSFAFFKKSLKSINGYTVMVQPGVRSNCDFVSRDIYEEFTWPLTMKYADAVIEAGVPVHFHYDANWTSFLDFFTYFPKGTCIFDSDGQTDILKVKEILGDRMAITGNTPSAMLALGTPDDIYSFVANQVEELGSEGYIVSSSCTIPSNAKSENIKAMVNAARSI